MAAKDIIGQFGVGFYSAFMVATKIEVYSKSSAPGSTGVLWTSDGSGTYSIQVQRVAHHLRLCDLGAPQGLILRASMRKENISGPVHI